ncbi:MAG: DNA-directed RNA polymerase subunit beta, partial [Clostridia bacterium]|nr:DNA-directed RNA polymerase subunit beta [Clostridia bacterium]
MVKPHKLGKNVRMSFAKIDEALEMPNLIEVQKKSYNWFISEGLREVLRDVSPITDYSGNLSIEFVDFSIDPNSKYPVEECKERDVNYAAPLRVKVRLHNKNTGELLEREIFMGDIPLMTDNGTCVINGAERVIVSQIVRSPGIYYTSDMDKSGKRIFAATVIPYRGAWLEYETDGADIFYVRIDKNRKIPVSVLIRALGIETDSEIVNYFGDDPKITATVEHDICQTEADKNGTTAGDEALKEIYKKLRPGEPPLVESAQLLLNNLFFDPKRYDLAGVGRYKFDKKLALGSRIVGHILSRPVISPVTGEFLCDAGETITAETAALFERSGVNEVFLRIDADRELKVFSNGTVFPEHILGTDLKDCGIGEKVKLSVLQEIIEQCGGDVEAVKEEAKKRVAELVPKHITKDDIFA